MFCVQEIFILLQTNCSSQTNFFLINLVDKHKPQIREQNEKYQFFNNFSLREKKDALYFSFNLHSTQVCSDTARFSNVRLRYTHHCKRLVIKENDDGFMKPKWDFKFKWLTWSHELNYNKLSTRLRNDGYNMSKLSNTVYLADKNTSRWQYCGPSSTTNMNITIFRQDKL